MDTKKIEELMEARRKLLEERPELQEIQDKIDKALEKAGSNQHNRCVIIQNMMLDTWYKMLPATKDLEEALKPLLELENKKNLKLLQ